MCVHPITFLARKIVDVASSLYCYVETRLQKRERGGGTGLRYRLIYNLQFLFFRCLHFTRRSFLPSSLVPLLSLSPLFSQFCLLQRHCFPSVLNYEGKLCDRKSRNSSLVRAVRTIHKCLFPRSNRHRSYFQPRRRFVYARRGRRGEERRASCSRCFQMISIIT